MAEQLESPVGKENFENESCNMPLFNDNVSKPDSETGSHISIPYSGDGEDIYTVERVIGKRVDPETGEVEYRIKWKNYPASSNTWEPLKNIYCTEVIDEYERLEELKRKKREEKQKGFDRRKEKPRKNKRILTEQKQGKNKREDKPKTKKRIISAFKDSSSESEEEITVPAIPSCDLGYTLKRIIGASRMNNQIYYLLEYNEKRHPELVFHKTVGQKYPQQLIKYLISNSFWVPN